VKYFLLLILTFSCPLKAIKLAPLTDSIEIPCGLMVRSGVDENDDGKLSPKEIIIEILICDENDTKGQKVGVLPPIVRTMPK